MHDSATIVFVLSAGLLFYFLFGYPATAGDVSLASRAGDRQRSHAAAAGHGSRCRCTTAQAFLRQKLESILALDYPQELLEILVISDGSTDATDSIAGEFASSGVRLLRVAPRR